MAETSLYAYIKLTGNDDFPLDAVTECLGIQPTRTWKVGEKVHADIPLKRFYTPEHDAYGFTVLTNQPVLQQEQALRNLLVEAFQ